jgi:EmrB/QacA subfamily drug resistance transporter
LTAVADRDHRWLSLFIVCFAQTLIIIDATIVNVALPVIEDALDFSPASLAWVVNAYLLTFGGFLLLGGRAGDLFGRRRLFIFGIVLFTAASALCGFATSQELLIVGRAIQGLGGAIIAPVALAIIVTSFPEPRERAKAMGIWTVVAAGGATLGVVLGGAITDALGWEWIFFINLPVGAIAAALAWVYLDHTPGIGVGDGLDIAGAVTVTGALVLAVYAIVEAASVGWLELRTIGLLAVAVVLLAVFVWIERRSKAPLVPLGIFCVRSLRNANVMGMLLSVPFYAQFFFTALYMQQVLGYTPLETGLAYLPSTLLIGALSVGLSAWLVQRFGLRNVLVTGILLLAAGLLFYARAPAGGDYWTDLFAGMVIVGIGAPLIFMPTTLWAMSEVGERTAGLASGLVNTAWQVGGALGLAVLASVAAARGDSLRADGESPVDALLGGFHVAFLVGAAIALLCAAIVITVLPRQAPSPAPESA